MEKVKEIQESKKSIKRGKVYLIGAGPGDPDLLTLKARKLLDNADVIAYDSLISANILSTLSLKSIKIPIGYRGHGSSKISYGLHPTVIAWANQGKDIVRLKSGDPFIFGRASQECLSLIKEGLDFEVVPGISSGPAAAISAGLPLTHRDISSDITFASGHDLRGGSKTKSNWEVLAKTTGTIVIYMAASKIKENCKRLVDFGKKKETPALYVACATCGNEEIIVGKLSTLGILCENIDLNKQAVIIIGDVIKTREIFNWKKKLILNQKNFLVLRQRETESKVSELLKSLGALVIEAPLIENRYFKNKIVFKNKNFLIEQVGMYKYFIQNLIEEGLDIRALGEARFYAIGKDVEKELESYGIKVVEVLDGHCIKAIKKSDFPKEITIVGRKDHNNNLIKDFESLGYRIELCYVAEKYETYLEIKLPTMFDGIICASSSCVKSLYNSDWFDRCKENKFYTIGDYTDMAARECGVLSIKSERDSIDSLVELIIKDISNEK